jgi:aminopeptidase N
MLDSDNRYKKFELPGAKPHYTPDRPGQVEHIFLDLILDIEHHACVGTCQIRLNPIRDGIEVLTLDAVELAIDSVCIGDEPQSWEYDGAQLRVMLEMPTQRGEVLELAIAYKIETPRRGMYFIQPDAHYPHKPVQVWTQGEDEDSRFWFPCFDYPGQLSTSAIRIQVPKPYMAISNGTLVQVEEADQHKTYHWAQNQVHPTYLMTLAIGNFVELRDNWQDKPITYYVESGKEAAAQISLGKTPRMVEFFSQTYGYPYAYDKYAQVCVDDFIFGGMENTSTTLLTDRCLLDQRAAIDNLSTETLVAHELAHQWFGDLVVIKHWSHAWIKEGMASYAEVLWLTAEYGEDLGAYYLLGQARSYLSEDADRYRRPLVTNVYREAIELYDSHIYEKGACIYHMLRAALGNDLFQQAIAKFLQTHAHDTVETVDLLRAIEAATGRNLANIFDQYVYRGGHPDYKVSYSWDGDSNLAKLTVTQTQAKTDAERFDLKIPIGLSWVNESYDQVFSVRVHEREQSFYFPCTAKPDYVSFDQGNHTLKTVELDYPLPELRAQLAHDPDPIARIYAAAAIAKKGGLEAVKALGDALQHDSFWGVRLEVAQNLATIKLDQSFAVLAVGLNDPEARVRRATIEALTQIKTAASYEAVAQIARAGDASYLVEAAALHALGKFASSDQAGAPSAAAVLEILAAALADRSGWNEVVRIGAVRGLSEMTGLSETTGGTTGGTGGTTAAVGPLALLLQSTRIGQPQPLRLAATRALGKISIGQDPNGLTQILHRLQELSRESFYLMQVAVLVALEQMETPKAIGILQSLGDQCSDGRIRRMTEEAIREVQAKVGTDPAMKQLRDEMERLRQENQTLESRLAQLEARLKG